jgi:hypothetical protein
MNVDMALILFQACLKPGVRFLKGPTQALDECLRSKEPNS